LTLALAALYSARCGLVHAFAASSRATRSGDARTISYAWGNAKVEDLEAMIRTRGLGGVMVPVQVASLRDALMAAFDKFIHEVGEDDERVELTLKRAGELYDNVPPELMRAYVDRKPGK
jgi:hypothetical protein